LTITLLFSLSLSLHAGQQSESKGLFGTTNLKAYIGKTSYEDQLTASFLNNNIQYILEGSFKINNHISAIGGVSKFEADKDYNGTTGYLKLTSFYLGGLYHFIPNGSIDPFISLSLGRFYTDDSSTSRGKTYKSDNSYNMYRLNAGIEFELSDIIFVKPSFRYRKRGGEYVRNINTELYIEVIDNFYINGNVDIELREKDKSYYLGASLKF
jgi:hypothetical protein